MRYLGSKESLTNNIIDLLKTKDLLKKDLVFFDAFCGMGSVADALKTKYSHIIINDLLKCASIFTEGRLLENSCNFSSLKFDPFEYLNNNLETKKGFIYKNYSKGGSSRMYFSEENAGRIDYFRNQIEIWYINKLISKNEYTYLLACLIESVSCISNTAGVYGAFLKHWDSRALKPIKFNRLNTHSGSVKKITSLNSRIEEIIGDIDCDILYLDPPYTQNQYGTQYHLLETIILNDDPNISAVTGSRPTTPLRSKWSMMYYSHILLDKIIAKTKAKHIIFSYNNDGFMSKEYIESTLKRYGIEDSYKCISIEYKKYKNSKCKGNTEHFEYLFYIEKKKESEIIIESPLNYTGNKSKMVHEIQNNLPKCRIDSFIDLFGGGFNVGININTSTVIYNDINFFVEELIKSFQTDSYKYLQTINKLIKKYDLAPNNKKGYIALRNKYNNTSILKRDPRMLYTLILYSFQQQIRFNSKWEYNNPVGSRWFNESLLSKFIAFSRVMNERNIIFSNKHFAEFNIDNYKHSFVYADPPYRSTLGVYNDGKRGFQGWTSEHEKSLCEYLNQVNNKNSYFMLSYVIENDSFRNEDIVKWATTNKYRIIEINQFQGRYNNRKEVLIVNY